MDTETMTTSTLDRAVETAVSDLERILHTKGVFSDAALVGAAIGAVMGPIGLLIAAGAGGAGTIVGKQMLSKKRAELERILDVYSSEISPSVRERAERVLLQSEYSPTAKAITASQKSHSS